MRDICKTCGREMKMYYRLWCPVCDAPSISMEPHINFIQSLNHIDEVYENGFHRSNWKTFCDILEFRNDTSVSIQPKYIIEYEDDHDECLVKLVKYMKLENYEKVYLDVSW
jgi:hypothetical protein